MKLGVFSPEASGAFSAYLPTRLAPPVRASRVYLAFYEDDLALGAAVVDVGSTALNVVSLEYDDSVEAGVCEELLLEQLLPQAAKTAIEEVTLLRHGTPEELARMDRRMLAAGLFAIPVETESMETTLGALTGTTAFRQLAGLKVECTTPLGQVSSLLVRRYNTQHPYAPIPGVGADPLISHCCVEAERISALLLVSAEPGSLTIDWLGSDGVSSRQISALVRDSILAAQEQASPETRLVLACAPGSVGQLAEKLSFAPVRGQKAHLYKRYLK